MTDKEKLEKIRALADNMYYHMSNLTTDTRPIRQVMNEYHQFIINECHKEEPVSDDLEDASEKCDIQTEKEAEIEYDFVMGIIKNEHRLPTFDDAIKYGMRLKEKEIQSTIELAEDHAMPEDERRNGMKLSN